MNKLNVENTVLCEQVRVELGGKHTLLGAFAPELNIPEVPANVLIAAWVSGKPSGVGQFEAEFRVLGPNEDKLIGAKVHGEFSGLGNTSMVIGPFPLAISGPGDYLFQWNFGDQWDRITTLRLHLVPIATPTNPPSVSPQPS